MMTLFHWFFSNGSLVIGIHFWFLKNNISKQSIQRLDISGHLRKIMWENLSEFKILELKICLEHGCHNRFNSGWPNTSKECKSLHIYLGKIFGISCTWPCYLPSQKISGNITAEDNDMDLHSRGPWSKEINLLIKGEDYPLNYVCKDVTEHLELNEPSETQGASERCHFSWKHTETVWMEAGWHKKEMH